ncbi:ATP-binding protein [Domibacillus sp. DTU_2020_1001157_1_SI_ALB_TIR_016]|uniref:ATP-binding protein n=1 Tax=Domibacillus sp. DTU_2020_1001157_1_SI_ALB_TIR_016 TaxID=3077789 RepID=UPI003977E206
MFLNITTLPESIQSIIHERKKQFGLEEDTQSNSYIAQSEEIVSDTVISLALGKNILLKGPTGSGKTKLSESLAAFFGQPVHSINCSIDLDAEAMLGFKTIVEADGKTQIDFVEGPVIQAMKKGHLLYIDEINMAKPETLPILNGVLDYRRQITNPFTGEVVTAKPTFSVIAAVNEGYAGTAPMNEALKNRFIVFEIPYISGDILLQVLKQQSVLQDQAMLEKFVSLSGDLTTLVESGRLPEEASSIRALVDACDLALYMPPMRAVESAIAGKLDDEREKAAVLNAAETWFA